MEKKHFCYILRNGCQSDKNRTYNGYTINPWRRLRQHNQEIKGGAQYTKKWGNKCWNIYLLIGGFPDKHNAMQCEWKLKHPAKKKVRPHKYNSPEGRIMGLIEILQLDRWTSNSSYLLNELNLEIWILEEYAYLLQNIPSNVKINIVSAI